MALLLGAIFLNWHTVLSLDKPTERLNLNQIAFGQISLFLSIHLAIMHSKFKLNFY